MDNPCYYLPFFTLRLKKKKRKEKKNKNEKSEKSTVSRHFPNKLLDCELCASLRRRLAIIGQLVPSWLLGRAFEWLKWKVVTSSEFPGEPPLPYGSGWHVDCVDYSGKTKANAFGTVWVQARTWADKVKTIQRLFLKPSEWSNCMILTHPYLSDS